MGESKNIWVLTLLGVNLKRDQVSYQKMAGTSVREKLSEVLC